MAVNISSTASGVLPFSTTTTTNDQSVTNEATQGTSQGINENMYTDAQKAAQGQALSSLSGVLSGQSVPSSFGLPQSVYDAAIATWNKNTAPILTAQHGAGTPALGSSLEELILQLSALGGQNAMSNYRGIAGDLGNFAFKPVGNVENKSQQQTGQTIQNRNVKTEETGFDSGGALDALMSILGSTFQALPFP